MARRSSPNRSMAACGPASVTVMLQWSYGPVWLRSRVEPEALQVVEGEERRLRGVDRADADELAAQPVRIGDAGIGPYDDDRGEVLVGVAHGQGRDADTLRLAEAPGPHPGQRRVPGGVDAAGEEVLHLPLVVGVEDVVEIEVAFGEPTPEPVPDRDYLGVVGDGPHEQRFSVHHCTGPRS